LTVINGHIINEISDDIAMKVLHCIVFSETQWDPMMAQRKGRNMLS